MNAKDLGYHVLNGNPSHLSKEELAERAKNQIKLGDKKFKISNRIKTRIEAFKKWKEIVKVFKETDLVTSADIGVIERYCLLHADYIDLVNLRNKNVQPDTTDLFGGVIVSDTNNLIAIEGLISKKCVALQALEDRLFLNSVARVKNIPKKEQEKFKDPLEQRGFANV